MSKLIRSSALVSLFALAVPVFAQNEPPPAHVAVLDGDVSLARDGEVFAAVVNMPVVSLDRLSTTAGRAEVLYPDGTAFDLDEGSAAEFGRDGRVHLLAGRAILVVPAAARNAHYEIETANGTVVARGAGKYRADGAAMSAWALNQRSGDAFDGWSDGLRAARTVPAASASVQYLPEELQSYTSTLDQNGTWQYAPTYGYVWYPRVESDWRPYYEGTWTTVPAYGWTWVGAHPWEYPTHHYGRWAYANNRWFWIPGRAYSPAWVAWGYSGDYVSWSPLGIDGRPAVPMTVGYGNPWTAWTVVPKTHFGGRGYVPRVAVPGHQIATQTMPFVVQNSGPSIAVPRQPPTPAFGTAVPRVAPAPASPGTVLPPTPTVIPTPTPAPPVTYPTPQRSPDDRRPRYPPPPSYSAPQQQPNATPQPPSATQQQQPPSPPAGSTPPQRTPPQTRESPKAAPPPSGSAAPRKDDPPPSAGAAGKSSATKSGEAEKKPAEKAKPAENPRGRGRGGR